MRTSTLSQANRMGVILATLLASLNPCLAGDDLHAFKCSYSELVREERPQPPNVYRANSSPWTVLVDELGGHVEIFDSGSKHSCKIELEDVRRVYAGRNILVLRVTEISSDYVFFFNAASCKMIRKPINLGANFSEANEQMKLHRLGLCDASEDKHQNSSP
jgi:hypothetical protein